MKISKKNLVKYYARRAFEYENIYLKPERQIDLQKLKTIIPSYFSNLRVLEIACGTGYWTQFISKEAKEIYALDYNRDVIEIAKLKDYGNCQISFHEEDAYLLSNINGTFSAGFCGFWWSHIPKNRINEFINKFHSRLTDNAIVVLVDNKFVQESSTPISRSDESGNTYQFRKLKDDSEFEVLKNFFTEVELKKTLKKFSRNLEYLSLTYYWLIKYNVKKRVDYYF